jgi:hypothetical protein
MSFLVLNGYNELFLNKSNTHRFSLLNALKSHINLWKTGQRPVIFCVAIRTFISASDMTLSLSMMTPLEPLSPVSVHYYDVGCLPEKWLILHWSIHSPETAGNRIQCERIVKFRQKPGTPHLYYWTMSSGEPSCVLFLIRMQAFIIL